ncbi:hemerythrin [Denitratisoma sp. DHT3]|uniref:hemerythrin domain-containing protein n=1 Tax=Denitratisoma sp. DHT3 TaxID=1981880 RepID=UPI0011983883|nr:hemerythrin domain-containing protein [Denitratisoma sp. DHT3]QDX81059.1 hemerythrin [Denitratisoma sp. DHT3]
MSLTEPLRNHHRHCDELFAEAEEAASSNDWPRCERAFEGFRSELENHFSTEEQTLFPAFESATGMTSGPTQVMRQEHGQMRALVEQMAAALQSRQAEPFGGACETLLILMQQHNFKEENILYSMCDQRLAAMDDLPQRLAQGIANA